MAGLDIVLLSNGPGEVATWVRPVVRSLRQRLGEDREQVRVSLVLAPCPNATGQEVAIAQRYPELDRIQSAEHFWPFLLWGKTAEHWDWRDRGLVIFLGGDQIFPVVISKRLGYRSLIYAEWEARWLSWVDGFALRQPEALAKVPLLYQSKCHVVGDLMADVSATTDQGCLASPVATETFAILPGSKRAKLMMGVPFMLAIADHIHQHRPQTRFWIPVAPTLTPEQLVGYTQLSHNPMVLIMGGPEIELIPGAGGQPTYFKTGSGAMIELDTQFPAYERLAQSQLCVTTVGANTAELGALGLPMLVVLPTQQLDAMRAWDGLPGVLANLPGVGSLFAKLINIWALRRLGLMAWPNIWAQEMIVPEFVGRLDPAEIARAALEYLEQPERLATMRDRLRQVRGEAGAATKLVDLAIDILALN
jgi:hypothetical protein